MKKFNIFLSYLLLLLLIFCSSCQETNQTANQEEENHTKFEIDPSKRNIVKGKKGGILIIPDNCFVDDQGNPITEKVNIKFIEAYSIQDIINNDLETRTADGILVSNGMVNLEATIISGETVQIAPNKTITLKKETPITDTNTYQFFTQEDGLWANPQPQDSYLTYLPLKDQVTLYYYSENGSWEDRILSKKELPDPKFKLLDSISILYFVKEGGGKYFSGYSNPTILPDEVLDNSFLSSREYEERFLAMPIEGEINYDIHMAYLRHLDKPLWVADSLVLEEVKENIAFYERRYPDTMTYDKTLNLKNAEILTMFMNQHKTVLPPDRLTETEIAIVKEFYDDIAIDSYLQSFSIMRSGWHNIDCYSQYELESIPLIVDCNIPSENVSLIFKDSKVVLKAHKKNDGTYHYRSKLPRTTAYLVAFTKKDEKLFFAKKEIQIGQNPTEVLELKEITLEEVEKELDAIEQGYN